MDRRKTGGGAGNPGKCLFLQPDKLEPDIHETNCCLTLHPVAALPVPRGLQAGALSCFTPAGRLAAADEAGQRHGLAAAGRPANAAGARGHPHVLPPALCEGVPEAYYYGGRVYRDLGDAPQALDYLQRAARLLEGSRDYSLKKVVYSQMGALFLFQDVYEEAMKAFKKSYQYQLLAHDKRGEVTTLCAIGYTFTALGNADSAMHYYRVAYEKALGYNDKKLVKRTLGDMASLYQQLKRYDLVEEILPELSNPKFFNRTVYYSILAEQYYNMGQKDSADYFYRKLLESDDPYTLQTAHWNLTSLAEERGDARTALKYLQQYKVWTDTIQKMTNFENIRKMQSLYNYQLREKENRELEEENARQLVAIPI